MTCPSVPRLAAAASGEDPRAALHAMRCAHCHPLLDAQLEVIALAQQTVAPVLVGSRRAQLAASILSDTPALEHAPRVRARFAFAAIAAAAAAGGLYLLRSHDEPASAVSAPTIAIAPREPAPAVAAKRTTPPPAPAPSPAPAVVSPRPVTTPSPPPASLAAGDAQLTRRTIDGLDTIELRDGTIELDTRGRAPATASANGTTIAIAGRTEIVARGGVIVSAHVFAGTAEIRTGSERTSIETGEIWTPPAGPPSSLAAFRAGWQALRAERFPDAIAAFDLAIDPVVVEDAVFWAAVAAERAGMHDEARQRYEDFVTRFASSPRVDAARAALDRLH